MTQHKPPNLILTVLVLWVVLMSIGPVLVVLIHAAIPLIIVLGVLAVALFHTRRW
jgi:hypothetical protein